jgi:hypothetical protein
MSSANGASMAVSGGNRIAASVVPATASASTATT